MHPEIVVEKKGALVTLQDVAKAAIPPQVWRHCYGARYVRYNGNYTYVWAGGNNMLMFDPEGDKYMEVELVGSAPTIKDAEVVSSKIVSRMALHEPLQQERPQPQP